MTEPINIAFESGKLTYSSYDVDLYNSGVNQLLSVSANRGHNLFHFRTEDVFMKDGIPYANMSKLDYQFNTKNIDSYKNLRKIGDLTQPLSDMEIVFLRADDIKPSTPGIEILKTAEKDSIFLENIEDTLMTTDKYEVVRRCDVPQPITYASNTLDETLEKLNKLPQDSPYFVLKDRFGYGCGKQVHRIKFDDPMLESKIKTYISDYKDVLVQEYCKEVEDGDLVVTFFDGELIETMKRLPSKNEWKTNASLGANEVRYNLSEEQKRIAKDVVQAFKGCRFSSVDLLESGKVLEINAFPGGKGLYNLYGISVGEIIMNKLEPEVYNLRKNT